MRYAERNSSTRPLCNTQIIFGHRKPRNLSEYLVRSSLPLEKRISSFPPKCNRFLRCKHCPQIRNKRLSKKQSSSTKRTYKIPMKVSCTSSNLIYCLECPECSLQYVGKTKNKFLIRINQHLNDIKHERDTPISRHFNKHKVRPYLYVLQLIKNEDSKFRDTQENYWIARLHTISPYGMNLLDWGIN